MNGGPSQVDLFDPKPLLEKYAGTVPNRDLTSDITSPTQSGGLLPSPYRFSRHGAVRHGAVGVAAPPGDLRG